MTDFTETRADAAALTAELRAAAAEGRKALAGIADGARASKSALRDATDATRTLSSAFRTALGGAFRSAALDGAKLSDVLHGFALDLSRSVARQAVGGLSDQLGGALGQALGGLFGKGAACNAGQVRRFAQGGIVSGPTAFPMRGAVGLMGEAGPEAIMPLQRGPDGRLGVAASGSAPVVNVTINTPDAASFERSRTQIAATLARAVARGQRNL